MATTYAAEVAGLALSPVEKPDAENQGARLLQFRGTIVFAAQAAADIINIAKVPKGYRFAYGVLNNDTSTGTATLAIGVTGTTGKYRAAAVKTTINTPEVFGVYAALAEETADQLIQALVGTAALPGAGAAKVDLYFTKAG